MIEDMEENETGIEEIRERLESIAAGKYTFYFTVTDGTGTYYYSEDEEKEIELTAPQARGLLFSSGREDLFEGLEFDKDIDEYFIESAADNLEISEESNTLHYSGECPGLDGYLDAWETLVSKILAEEIKEPELDGWLEFFDDSCNYESDIESWHEDMV